MKNIAHYIIQSIIVSENAVNVCVLNRKKNKKKKRNETEIIRYNLEYSLKY